MTTPPTPPAGRTGRYLLVFDESLLGDDAATQDVVRSASGATTVATTRDAGTGAVRPGMLGSGGALLFSELGIALVDVPADRLGEGGAFTVDDPRVIAIEPERIMRALGHDTTAAPISPAQPPAQPPAFVDDDTATWGLRATGVLDTDASGDGVALAVLDTGLALDHPDLAGREVVSRSFVDGEEVTDVQGHGTHCAGTAAGPLDPEQGPRYGVAPGVTLLVGKVLSDAGTDADILAGISWAISEGAQVVSMSLGADQREVSAAYETVGRRAMAAGTLIVAAAGNNAQRSAGRPGFVGVPANSPSIMAVAALDQNLAVAEFSAAATDVDGGAIDIAAPGVDVLSATPLPQRYDTLSGTSMACPHVAGIAALWAQRSGARGQQLWDAVCGAAQSLSAPVSDVGAGLAKAPGPA